MGCRPAMEKGFSFRRINWPKQKNCAFGFNIICGKEFDVKFIRIMINFINGIVIEIGF